MRPSKPYLEIKPIPALKIAIKRKTIAWSQSPLKMHQIGVIKKAGQEKPFLIITVSFVTECLRVG
jgi:hypothetical protein